jgi:hypothetical protein
MDGNPTPIEDVSLEALVAAMRTVSRKGLPATEAAAGELLVNLRSVYARAVVPIDSRSRLSALNELLPRLIASIGDPVYREAAQVLFGLAPGTRDSQLSDRRRRAATLLGYSAEHFRGRKEDDVLLAVAGKIYDDLLRYRSRVKRASESLEPTGDTPMLGPEHLTHEEELVSRIWQHVYGLRAEMIACLRLSREHGLENQVEDHRQAAIREQDELQHLLREYVDTYGQTMIRHGDAEFGVEALSRLADWSL